MNSLSNNAPKKENAGAELLPEEKLALQKVAKAKSALAQASAVQSPEEKAKLMRIADALVKEAKEAVALAAAAKVKKAELAVKPQISQNHRDTVFAQEENPPEEENLQMKRDKTGVREYQDDTDEADDADEKSGRGAGAKILMFVLVMVIVLALAAGGIALAFMSGILDKFLDGGKINANIGQQTVTTEPVTTAQTPQDTITVEDVISSGGELGYDKEYTYEFISDLSEYEQYMNPAEKDKYLALINYENTLDPEYTPENLTDVANTRRDRETQQLVFEVAKALEALFTEANANGITDVTVTSGYRTYNTQQYLFDQKVKEYMDLGEAEAYRVASTIVAIPGTSEHQSGLCADLHNLPGADISFAETEAGKWLAENCFKFGFILRYPADKTDITKISFEPWHFRYVGRYHASKMHELGMCLEEYLQYLNG